MDDRSGHHRKVCMQGVTMAGVHSYGKDRASVGLVSAVWVTRTEPAHSAIGSHKLQLRHATPYGALLMSPALQ